MKKCFLLMIPLLMACNDGTDKTAALTVDQLAVTVTPQENRE